MNSRLLLFIFLLLQVPLHSQHGLIDQINERLKSSEFEPFELAKVSKQTYPDLRLNEDNAAYLILDLNETTLKDVYQRQPNEIRLTIPYFDGGEKELLLVKKDLVTSDFLVREGGTNQILYGKEQSGVHYQGVLAHDNTNIAAISFFENEVSGLICLGDQGNLNLGKLEIEGSKEHIIFNDRTLDKYFHFECGIEDNGDDYTKEELFYKKPSQKNSTRCVRVYFEADYDVYRARSSSVSSTTNFIEGLFNVVATIYANENINIVISEILVWTTQDPYPNNDLDAINSFRTTMVNNGFNGDLAHLIFDGVGGGRGYAPGLCRPANPVAVSNMNGLYSYSTNLAVYSWPVYVLSHELGHNFNSRHTHACVWNGNNTAIDGCSGFTEQGTCPLPGIPSQGGTIMSYCHNTLPNRINFNLGFGPQPGNVMRSWYNGASCIGTCNTNPPPPATCNVTFTNTGCQTAGLYRDNNGSLQFVRNISGNGSSYTVNSSEEGERWVMRVGSTTVGNYTTACPNSGYSFNAGGCGPTTCNVTFTNTGCQTAGLYRDNNGSLQFVRNISGNGSSYTVNSSAEGERWVIRVGSTTVGNYTTQCPNSGYSFNSGGCAGDCNPPSNTERIVDDNNATYTGTWGSGANAGYYGSGYRFATTGGSKTATFTPNLEEDGSYELFIHYVSANNRATNARVDIYELDGTVRSVNVNQQINGSRWNSLGTYDMATNTKAVLTNQGANNIIIADAFRWIYRGCPDNPPPATCNVTFTNTGCQTAGLYRDNNGSLQFVRNINGNGSSYTVNSSEEGERWVMRVGNTTVGNYTTACPNSGYSFDSGGCGPVTCDVRFTNTGCQTAALYRDNNGSLEFISNINGNNGQYTVSSATEGERWVMRVGSNTVSNYTTSCPNSGHSFDSGDCPPANCNVTFSNTGCQTAALYTNDNGSLQFVANVNNGGNYTADTYAGAQWIVQVGSSAISSYTVECPNSGHSFDSRGCDGDCEYSSLFFDDFETGFGNWLDGGSDCLRTRNSNFASSGQYSIEIRDDTGTSHVRTNSLDLSNIDEITVDFTYFTRSMEDGERFIVEYSTDGGSNYNSAEEFVAGTHFNNSERYFEAVTIPGPFSNQTVIRFRCDASDNGDEVFLDDITIETCGLTAVTCDVTFTNTGCQTADLYRNNNGSFELIGTVTGGGSYTTSNSTEGDQWELRVGSTTVGSYTTACPNNGYSFDGGDCPPATCDVTFTNTGCQTADLYRNNNGSFELIGTVSGGGGYTASNSTEGDEWELRVGSTIVGSYTTACPNNGYSFDGGDCPPATCDVTFTNTGCQTADLYRNNNGSFELISTVTGGGTYTANSSTEGDEWELRVGSTTVGSYTTACPNNGYSFDGGDCPPATCDVTFTNTGCQTADLYRNNNGSFELIGTVTDGGTYTANSSTEGDEWELRVGSTTVGSYTTACPNNGYSFDSRACNGDCVYSDLLVDDFERGFGNWIDGGSDCLRNRNNSAFANSGEFCIEIRDDTNTSHVRTDNLDLSESDEVTVDFTYITRGMETGERFVLEYSTDGGNNYTLAEEFISGTHFDNGVRYFEAITILGPLSAQTIIRFRCDASQNNDEVFLDDITIETCDVPPAPCDVTFSNVGCETAELYRDNNGTLEFITSISGSSNYSASTFAGEEWVMQVGSDIVSTYTVVCPNDGHVFDAGDCGGACVYTTLFSDNFESGFGNWIDGGNDCLRTRNSNFASSGEYSIEIRDDTGSSHTRTNNLNLSDTDEVTVDFTYITRSMEPGERFMLEYSTDGGNNYTIVEEYIVDIHFANGERYFESVIIPGPFSAQTVIRFRCDGSRNNDEVFLDDITIETCDVTRAIRVLDNAKPELAKEEVGESLIQSEEDRINTDELVDFAVFPNPTTGFVNVNLEKVIGKKEVTISIMNGLGAVVKDFDLGEVNNELYTMDLSELREGSYFVWLKMPAYRPIVKKVVVINR